MAGRKAQAGIKIAGRNINNLRYADDTTLMADSEEELKSFFCYCCSFGHFNSLAQHFKELLDESKEKSEKVGLKLNIQKPKIMASGPITSWQTVETVIDFILGGSKITANGEYSNEVKDTCSLEEKL